MKLTINGKACEVTATTLSRLLADLEFEGDWLATAVNSEVVPAAARADCHLCEGDRIEILTPMQGG
ncbi:sulfur carrier protein ThiS [Mesorhizobium sp. M1A.F.Ca.IN.020.06.1.1]|uniref:sulfur carrier protein ThiS n=2 Tax=Mesorhizobium TaxID=68287 RepID=UPI000FCB9481|nr:MULTISPECIES: sulfur carrier protein ThiS [unclassified Mesorhizobium]RUW01307.1 sulfur carrier protein ThiS [Mesorhizobium sp. M1A.F.Ca.IN.022.05.2.1]RUW07225.1 sulfur carrier protein ThiS [Mesorhizobium sp. M1A.F.Ca.IN.020.06.1.1]RWF83176.1 MAG: sulfur carrier protein ThiS [Mesorhizobium sp.]RWG06735.1 MAG: sulfur carrier protein ThiS [Mesorhizobium sp.]RWG84037.1 MAG: sulfur carrier protein ThiS [Mesorhizobium sp.]